jgi:hypothetical protein
MKLFEEIIEIIGNPAIPLNPDYLRERDFSEESITKIIYLKENLQNINSVAMENQLIMIEQMKQSGIDSFKVIKDLKNSLSDTLDESRKSQNITKYMFIAMFSLGLILIGFSIYFAFMGQNFLAITFGSFGMLDIIAHLLADPPLKMQDSRSNYAQLTIGILAWFNDMLDKSGMASQNQQLNNNIQNSADIDWKNKMSANNESLKNYLLLSEAQINNTIKLLMVIDDVAEPTKKIQIKKTTETESEIQSAKT